MDNIYEKLKGNPLEKVLSFSFDKAEDMPRHELANHLRTVARIIEDSGNYVEGYRFDAVRRHSLTPNQRNRRHIIHIEYSEPA